VLTAEGEIPVDEKDVLDGEVETIEDETPEQEGQPGSEGSKPDEAKKDWDKTRQQIDQLNANIRRFKQEKDDLVGGMEVRDKQIDELRSEMNVLKASKVEHPKLDPLNADIPTVVQRLNDLEEDRAKDKRRIAELDEKARRYEQGEQERVRDKQRQATIDKVCKPLDEKYGAKYRNAAKSLADRWVDEGVEARPEDALDARDLMTRAYEKVVAEKKSTTSKPKGPPQDSGAAGTSFKDVPTEGSLSEVAAAMRKSYKLSRG
jgi:chromosome segregation ATPase